MGLRRGAAPAAPLWDASPEPNHRPLTHGVYTNFRLPPAPRGSRFLRKLAPCGRGGCAAPLAALEWTKEGLCLTDTGALPLQPVGERFIRTKPPPINAWRLHQLLPFSSSARLLRHIEYKKRADAANARGYNQKRKKLYLFVTSHRRRLCI